MAVHQALKTYSETFSDFAIGLEFQNLPRDVVEKAKLHLLDSLGIALVCSRSDIASMILDVVKSLGGNPQSTAIGTKHKFPAPNAALVNGSIIHGVDFDDTHLPALVHESSFVVPTALAVGELVGATGKDVITAAVAGYEVVSRMGMAAPQKFHDRGFHATPILGAFASAVIAGKLLGLKSDQIAAAMGITGSQGAGLQEFLHDGTWIKQMHPGWAAHSGIMAAMIAGKGFTAPHKVLEGGFGLYNSFLGPNQFDGETLTRGLGSVWETLKISFKLYPCCHDNHIFLDSAFHIKQEHNIKPQEIEEIHLRVCPRTEYILLDPLETKYNPPTVYAGRFSLPYALAVRLLFDEVGLEHFTEEKIKDPVILELARKVTYEVDPDAEMPGKRGYVAVRTRGGKLYEHMERFLRGTPDNPVGEEVIKKKFRVNCKQAMLKHEAQEIIDSVARLEDLENISQLMKLLY